MDGLKSHCLALAQEALKPPQTFNPTSPALSRKLEDVLRDTECLQDELTPRTAEFVYFPLHSLLQHESLGNRQTELLFDCLTALCKSAWRRGSDLRLDRAQQLLVVVTYLLCPEPASDKVSESFLKRPRSFHTAAFKLIDAIFESANGSEIADSLSKSTIVVQIITLLLDAVQYDDDDLQAQKASIKCLETIVLHTITNKDHRALVLPRAVSRLSRLLSPMNKRHFEGKIAALKCLGEIVLATVETGGKVRTGEWLATTMENLTQTFRIVQNLQRSLLEIAGSKVSLLASIFHFARNLFSNLDLGNFKDARDILVNIILLTKSQATDSKLAEQADNFLRTNESALVGVETQLVDELAALPSTLSSANESATLFHLRALQNAVELTASVDTVDSIVDAIQASLPLKLRKAPATALQNINEIEAKMLGNSALNLKDVGLDIELSQGTQEAAAQVLVSIGSTLHADEITQVVGDITARLRTSQFRSSPLDSIGLLWVACNIVRGSPAKTGDLFDLMTYCFENIDSELSTDAPAPQVAVSCYAIGEMALKQEDSFKEYLVDILYPLFSLIGHPESQPVRDQAGIAISKIAFACGYQSPQEMAIANKDYLVDGWSTQLNTLNFTPGTFESLASLIFISGETIIPYLDDVFTSLFTLMDHYHGYSKLVKGILTVFGALTIVVSKSSSIKPELPAPPIKKLAITTLDELIAELQRKPEIDPSILDPPPELPVDAAEDKDIPENFGEEDSDNEAIQDQPDEPEVWSYAVPQPTYMTLKRISEYCDRLMTHETAEVRLATLILVTQLMPFLAINKDMFLPIIHKTWPEAVSRVFDKEAYVVEQSFACLSAMARSAQDFVASRVDKLWPRIIDQYSPLIQRKWPHFTPEQRILGALASFFGVIVENVENLSFATLESGIVAFRPAFRRGEYPNLQEKLASAKPSYSDLLWLVLLNEPVSDGNDLHTVMPVYCI